MYRIKEVTITNKQETETKKALVIEFDDPKEAIVGEFLMTDAPLLDFDVLNDIETVLSGKSDSKTMSGNRCALVIKADKTVINDLLEGMFDGVETYPSYEIDTVKLTDLIKMWKEEKEKHAE